MGDESAGKKSDSSERKPELDDLDQNARNRHEFIKQWAEYVRTHDDGE